MYLTERAGKNARAKPTKEVWMASIFNDWMSHVYTRVKRLHALLPTFWEWSDAPYRPPISNAKFRYLDTKIRSMLLRHGSGSIQPTKRLVGTYTVSSNVYNRFKTVKCIAPQIPKVKWYFFIFPQFPNDRMERWRSLHGGFVPLTQTPPTSMKPLNEISSNISTAKCFPCFCEFNLFFTPTVGPVSVPSSVLRVQRSLQTTFASPPVANDNTLASSGPLEENTFPNPSRDSLCLLLLMSQKPFTLQTSFNTLFPPFSSWKHISGEENHHSSFSVEFSHKYFNAHMNLPSTATSDWRSPYYCLFVYDNTFPNTRFWPNPLRSLRSDTGNERQATAHHIPN